MTSLPPNRRSGSTVSGPAVSTHRRLESGHPRGTSVNPQRVDPYSHTTSTPSTYILNLPVEDTSEESHYHRNKVILSFEEEFTLSDAREWVGYFNQKRGTKLTIVDALPLALFLVLLDVGNPVAAKSALLAASPLGAHDVYALVNEFSEDPKPCNQRDFRHLVTVDIPLGTRKILRHIEFVVSPIGKYVKAKLASSNVNQHILVVVESQLKRFSVQGFFRLGGREVTKICFEYGGRNLRCCFCFSYRHLPSECSAVKPAFFLFSCY